MKIGIPKEVQAGETRVALVPGLIPLLIKDQHEVLVDARLNLGDVNDFFKTHWESEDTETIGGFVYDRLGRIPEGPVRRMLTAARQHDLDAMVLEFA